MSTNSTSSVAFPVTTNQTPTTATLSVSVSGFTNPVYAWTTTSGPGGAEFGDSASATPTVRYHKVGYYEHAVTVTDADGARRENSLWVVVQPLVTSAVIFPATAAIKRNSGILQLNATFYDQFCAPLDKDRLGLPQAWTDKSGAAILFGPTWSVSGPGRIAQMSGEFEPQGAGTATVTLTAGTVSATATITVVDLE